MTDALHKQLQKALRQGDLSTLARICATCPKATSLLLSKDSTGNACVHFASSQGHVDIVKLLVKLGADVDKENEYGWTPLMLASYYGHLSVVQFLLGKSVDPNRMNSLGLTALKCSVYQFHNTITSALIEAGVDVNHGGSQGLGLTALMIACQVKNHEAVCDLLQHGADCNYQSKSNGWTSLFYAIHPDDYSLVKILLNARAEPNIQDWSGRTGIQLAQEMGCDIDAMFGDFLLVGGSTGMITSTFSTESSRIEGRVSEISPPSRLSLEYSPESNNLFSRMAFKKPNFNTSVEGPESEKQSPTKFNLFKSNSTQDYKVPEKSLSVKDTGKSFKRQDSAEDGGRSSVTSQTEVLNKSRHEREGSTSSRKNSGWWSTLGKSK